MLDRCRVCVFSAASHFKQCMLWLTGNCFPKRVPLPPPAHSVLGSAKWSWEWQRASPTWATTREGRVPHVRPGWALQRRTQRCFVSPGTNGNGPKSFRETPVYSRVRPELQARLKMCRCSDIPNFCPHIACTVPHTSDTIIVHNEFSSFQEHLT